MIQFIKDMAAEYGNVWTFLIVLYASVTAIVSILVSISILFGGN